MLQFVWHTEGAKDNVCSHVKIFQNGLLAHDPPARCKQQDATSTRSDKPHRSGGGYTMSVPWCCHMCPLS